MKYLLPVISVLISFSASAQIVNIPDPVFKNWLLNSGINANGDGEIQVSEAQTVTSLGSFPSGITDLEGIGEFSNLEDISVWGTSMVTANLSGLTHLTNIDFLNCSGLKYLYVAGCTNLEKLYASVSQVESLDISGLTHLWQVVIDHNHLTYFNAQGCTALTDLRLESNYLSYINISDVPLLTSISAGNMGLLDSVRLNNCPNLEGFYANNNSNLPFSYLEINNCPRLASIALDGPSSFTSLDFSNCPGLSYIRIAGQALTYLNVKNGIQTTYANESVSPVLQYICADDFEVLALINALAPLPVNINSYCTFVPGGHFNTIQGTATFDFNGNGCDAGDPEMPNINIGVTDNVGGTYSTNTNPAGGYAVYTGIGNFTLTPNFSSPYFNINPSSANIVFDTTNNLLETADFCISPNGIHNDLEITLIPGHAQIRPGFDAGYAIVYKNKGTTILSGNVQFNFDDTKLDFISAIPAVSTQSTGQLSWSFSNLAPFESRIINMQFNVLASPVNNSGDTITFLTIVNPVVGDETPADNTFSVRQGVTNAIDPNDKVCLEGNKIGITDIGKFLHYVIHFQNTGTDTAFNIVLADTLSNNLDLTSVEFIGSSHPCTLRQTNKKLEFIFEDIKLLWESVNEPASHGYVAFRVKSKSSMVIGDSVNNKASIYFDFNPQVITNIATTVVSPAVVVAVKLDYFSAGKKDKTNLLTWKASAAGGSTNFHIEKSDDGIHFNNVGNIIATAERCQLPFNFTDDKPLAGKNYYRLRITDADGKYFYSNTLLVENNSEGLHILAVNSNEKNTIIYFDATKQQSVKIKLLTSDGKTIYNSSKTISAGRGQLNIGLKNISHGIYTLLIYPDRGDMITKQFMK